MVGGEGGSFCVSAEKRGRKIVLKILVKIGFGIKWERGVDGEFVFWERDRYSCVRRNWKGRDFLGEVRGDLEKVGGFGRRRTIRERRVRRGRLHIVEILDRRGEFCEDDMVMDIEDQIERLLGVFRSDVDIEARFIGVERKAVEARNPAKGEEKTEERFAVGGGRCGVEGGGI